MPSSAQRTQTRRAQPVIEGLEDRRLLSKVSLRHSVSTAATVSDGVLSHHSTQFAYTTPTGGHAVIQLIGLGNLVGTSVDASSGALNLVYGGTNAYSKIVSHVTGGGGQAPLESILNSQLITAGAQNSVSGVGGNVIKAVYLNQFDLVPGGNINLTSGVNTVVLDNVEANTQIHLRELPPAPTPTTTSPTSTLGVATTQSGTTTGVAVRGTTTTGGTTSSTLQAGQSTSITNEGVTATYESGKDRAQTLSSISGTFTPGANIVEPLATGTPGQTPRPAPPGVIFKVNQINGATAGSINLLTDPKVFGYDPTTGDLVEFDINLTTNTGTEDPTFVPIPVMGDPTSAGLSLAYVGNQLDVLVSSGTTVFAYNALTEAPAGFFSTAVPINMIATADTVTVLGSYSNNQLQMINLAASLQSGVAVPASGSRTFNPAAGFTLTSLTSLPGSTSVIASEAALFNTFQPTQNQLGLQPLNTTTVKAHHKKSEPATLEYTFTPGTATAITTAGAYTAVTLNLPNPPIPGAGLGSIDQSTALVAPASGGTNTISVSSGSTITLNYSNQLVALSQAFRPDLNDSALVDIQGDVQSIRGGGANGLVLNDNGNLNLVQFGSLTNSTIIGQPVGHLNIASRSNVTVLTPSRTINGSEGSFTNDGRNRVSVNKNLQPIGPLSQPNE